MFKRGARANWDPSFRMEAINIEERKNKVLRAIEEEDKIQE